MLYNGYIILTTVSLNTCFDLKSNPCTVNLITKTDVKIDKELIKQSVNGVPDLEDLCVKAACGQFEYKLWPAILTSVFVHCTSKI